jgi:hypothetical protein
MTRSSLLPLVLCAAALPSAARAGACDLVSKAASDAVVKVGGRTEVLAPGAWKPLPDCSALEVVKGPVQVRGVVGGVPQKVVCEGGPCSLPTASRSLVVSSTSSYRLVPGGHRMDEDVARRPGLPWGDVYSVDAAARFDLSALGGGPLRFTLRDARDRSRVFSMAVAEGKVIVPLASLKRGGRYAWEVSAADRAGALAAGGFQLLSDDDAAEVARALAAEGGADRSAVERTLDELAVYVAHDLDYEAAVLRESLRSTP